MEDEKGEKPQYRPSRSVKRAMSHHGPDVVEDFSSHVLLMAFQLGIDLIPVAVAGGAAAGAVFTDGCLSWALGAVTALLAWPSVIGLRGVVNLIANRTVVVLVYTDRLLVQHGSKYQDVPWAEVEEVSVSTQAGTFADGLCTRPGTCKRSGSRPSSRSRSSGWSGPRSGRETAG